MRGKCGLEVVGGQLLPGAPAHLLLITSATTTSRQSIVTPLHIFSCHVIKLRDVKSQVRAVLLSNGLVSAAVNATEYRVMKEHKLGLGQAQLDKAFLFQLKWKVTTDKALYIQKRPKNTLSHPGT